MVDYPARYAELMAPAFVAGLEQVCPAETEPSCKLDILLRIANTQSPIRDAIETVDWEAADLPNKDDFVVGELTPREFASRLMVYAYDDAREILVIAQKAAADLGLPTDVGLGDILRKSKGALLLPARLPDDEKVALFDAINEPEKAALYAHGPLLTEEPIRLVQTHDRLRLGWSQEVIEWASEVLELGRGCPALDQAVKLPNGGRQKLIHYFWDKMVEVTYPIEA